MGRHSFWVRVELIRMMRRSQGNVILIFINNENSGKSSQLLTCVRRGGIRPEKSQSQKTLRPIVFMNAVGFP
jgi:hypothetical protein